MATSFDNENHIDHGPDDSNYADGDDDDAHELCVDYDQF